VQQSEHVVEPLLAAFTYESQSRSNKRIRCSEGYAKPWCFDKVQWHRSHPHILLMKVSLGR
jgi:hypothetical protein